MIPRARPCASLPRQIPIPLDPRALSSASGCQLQVGADGPGPPRTDPSKSVVTHKIVLYYLHHLCRPLQESKISSWTLSRTVP